MIYAIFALASASCIYFLGLTALLQTLLPAVVGFMMCAPVLKDRKKYFPDEGDIKLWRKILIHVYVVSQTASILVVLVMTFFLRDPWSAGTIVSIASAALGFFLLGYSLDERTKPRVVSYAETRTVFVAIIVSVIASIFFNYTLI